MCNNTGCKAFNEKYEYSCAINNFAAIRGCREYHNDADIQEVVMRYTVRLTDDTVGTVESSKGEQQIIGDTVTVSLHDENGNFIEVVGEVDEVLVVNE